jgi:hypothetical protein
MFESRPVAPQAIELPTVVVSLSGGMLLHVQIRVRAYGHPRGIRSQHLPLPGGSYPRQVQGVTSGINLPILVVQIFARFKG